MKEVLRGLRENQAATNPSSHDRRLLGRTYTIPFDDVWRAATDIIASGRLRGWSLTAEDDQLGVIEASIQSLVLRRSGQVRVEIGLDENAQTRVDARSSSQGPRGDLGWSRRTLGRFFRALDRALSARPEQILDPTRVPVWLEPFQGGGAAGG